MTTLKEATWSEATFSPSDLLALFAKADRLNYKYYVEDCNRNYKEGFWVTLETEYGDKYMKLNEIANRYWTANCSFQQLDDFLNDALQERLNTVERERKLRELLRKLTPEEKRLLGIK